MATRERVVGVRELRARLSAYLRGVRRGETVTIGDRRRQPIARLVPFEVSSDIGVLEGLAARGIVALGAGKPRLRRPVKLRGRARQTSDIVVEDRR
jgi:prevent-host-death family protein